MKDDYDVSRYIPKKYHKDIEEIEVELDYDHNINRSVNYYRIWFKNGDRIGAVGIKGIVKAIKERSV